MKSITGFFARLWFKFFPPKRVWTVVSPYQSVELDSLSRRDAIAFVADIFGEVGYVDDEKGFIFVNIPRDHSRRPAD